MYEKPQVVPPVLDYARLHARSFLATTDSNSESGDRGMERRRVTLRDARARKRSRRDELGALNSEASESAAVEIISSVSIPREEASASSSRRFAARVSAGTELVPALEVSEFPAEIYGRPLRENKATGD